METIKKETIFAMVLTGMALGTAWAIRGQFGHEQGAAWAGGIGCLALLLLCKRQDWYNKAIKATFAGAVGWGLGGMMSYGAIVGYGRGVDFTNVYYGFLMLFVIGGLYGFIGGGLFGLTLADSPSKKVKWHRLIVEMTVGGIIFYFFIVQQLGIWMTPPRSEAWGVCAGIGLALLYYLFRKKQYAAMRVAIFAGLGGGFGFAFGNFLQVLGNVAQIKFNMWNVMEYSLGFFGGAGMAYGTLTSKWATEETKALKKDMLIPLIGTVLLIPFFVWQQSFVLKDLAPTFEKLLKGNPSGLVTAVRWFAFFSFIIPAIWWIKDLYVDQKSGVSQYSYGTVKKLFYGYFGIYILFTILVTGSFLSFYRIEQFLYILNFIILIVLIPKTTPVYQYRQINAGKWLKILLLVIGIIAILALIAIQTHGEIPGMNKRFE